MQHIDSTSPAESTEFGARLGSGACGPTLELVWNCSMRFMSLNFSERSSHSAWTGPGMWILHDIKHDITVYQFSRAMLYWLLFPGTVWLKVRVRSTGYAWYGTWVRRYGTWVRRYGQQGTHGTVHGYVGTAHGYVGTVNRVRMVRYMGT